MPPDWIWRSAPPVVTVTRRKPNLDAILAALKRKFDDWEDRWQVMRRHGTEEAPTKHRPLYVTYVGAERAKVREALSLTTVRGALPEPLRVAHLIAAGIVRGESRGRA